MNAELGANILAQGNGTRKKVLLTRKDPGWRAV